MAYAEETARSPSPCGRPAATKWTLYTIADFVDAVHKFAILKL